MSLSRDMDPFNELFDRQRGLGSTLWSPDGRRRGTTRSRQFPPINIYRNREGYLLRTALPGVSADDLSLEAAGRTLTLSAHRSPQQEEGESTHRVERWSGEFSRAIRLPEDADLGRIEASYRNGVLTVLVHQHESAKPRQVLVSTQ